MFHKRVTPWSLLLVVALFTNSAAYAAKLYKWIDKDGNIHYSEKPPAEEASKAPPAEEQPESLPEQVDTTAVPVPQPADLLASQLRADECQSLYHDLALYQGGQQITDSDGNVMIISAEMREAKIAEIKAQLDESCR